MQRKKPPNSKCEFCGFKWKSVRISWTGKWYEEEGKDRHYVPVCYTSRPTLCPQCKFPWVKNIVGVDKIIKEQDEIASRIFFADNQCPQCGYTSRRRDYKDFDNIEPNKDPEPEEIRKKWVSKQA